MAALGFGPDRIRTLVSMATESFHRVIKGENLVSTLTLPIFIRSSRFLHVKRTVIKAWTGLKLRRIGSGTSELATLERLKKSP